MVEKSSEICRPRKTREISSRTEERFPSPDGHFQTKRKVLRRKRHFSSSRVCPTNHHRTDGLTDRTLHELTEFQEGIPRNRRRRKNNGCSRGKGTQPYNRARVR